MALKAKGVKEVSLSGSESVPESARTIGGYVCENSDKFERAINGSMTSRGVLEGGVGENASPEEKIAEYDRLGGLITYGGRKIKTGAFWDFKKKSVIKAPAPVMEFRQDGEIVEIAVGAEVPVEVQAGEIIEKKKVAKNVEKAAKAEKAKKNPQIEDEE